MRKLISLILACFPCAAQTIFLHVPGVQPAVFDRTVSELPKGLTLDVMTATTDASLVAKLRAAQAIHLYFPSREVLAQVDVILKEKMRAGVPVFLSPPDTFRERFPEFEKQRLRNEEANRYWDEGGAANLNEFAIFLAHERFGSRVRPPKRVEKMLAAGIYVTNGGKTYANLEAWREEHPKRGDHPRVAVAFYPNLVRLQTLDAVDTMLSACELRDWECAGFFGWPISSISSMIENFKPAVLFAGNLTVIRQDDGAAIQKIGVPVINLLTDPRTRTEWETTGSGFAPTRTATNLGNPERVGAIAAGVWSFNGDAHKEGIEMLLDRAAGWIRLQRQSTGAKRLAVLHYNYPPGRGNVGANFLDVPRSLLKVLQSMRDAGYETGELPADAETLARTLDRFSRNVEEWAPGELAKLAKEPSTTLWPVKQYRQFYEKLAPEFRKGVEAQWGSPESSKMMTFQDERLGLCFVIPGLKLGSVWVGPQPLRTSFKQGIDDGHNLAIPPPHQYIAVYLWLRHVLHSDAVLHFGRHGTLEWLPGKERSTAPTDAMPQLLGGLPNLNYYIMDGGGEAMQARRRGNATLIGHLTPMLLLSGQEAKFEPLHKAAHRLEAAKDKNPEILGQLRRDLREEVVKLGLLPQLGLAEKAEFDEEAEKRVHAFLHEMEANVMPARLHRIGEAPVDGTIQEALHALLMMSVDLHEAEEIEDFAPKWAEELMAGRIPQHPSPDWQKRFREALEWKNNLIATVDLEVVSLLKLLDGKYLRSAPAGDPVRRPTALPAGANLHTADSAQSPSKAGCQVAAQLESQLLSEHKKKAGTDLKSTAIVLWYGETERNEGAMECLALRLAGLAPKWNQRGEVTGTDLVEREKLGRPRVNVVLQISGMYRDGYPEKIAWLHDAMRKAASSGEPDNSIAEQDRKSEKELTDSGMTGELARESSQLRIFGNAPGRYGSSVYRVVESGNGKDNPAGTGAQYLGEFAFGYSGDGAWGKPQGKAFQQQLKGAEQVLLSRSSHLYGALDLDDVYAYAGAMKAAISSSGGKADLQYANLRQAHSPRLLNNSMWLAQEMHSRLWNPKWIKEMKESGYAGARLLSRMTENLAGFQATTPEDVDPSLWRETFEVLEKDRENLGLQKFYAKDNPFARQAMLARFLRENQRGSLKLTSVEKATLMKDYFQSIERYGVACQAQVCGNRELRKWVNSNRSSMTPETRQSFEAYQRRISAATRTEQKNSVSEPGKPETSLSSLARMKIHFVHLDKEVESVARRIVEVLSGLSFGIWFLASALVGGLMTAVRRWIDS